MDGKSPSVVFHFDCAGRGRTMFRVDEKTRLITRLQELVSEEVPWIGFYTYGEIGPVCDGNYFHNYTAVVAGLYA
jgi:small ligand-binding sensory domain FIST